MPPQPPEDMSNRSRVPLVQLQVRHSKGKYPAKFPAWLLANLSRSAAEHHDEPDLEELFEVGMFPLSPLLSKNLWLFLETHSLQDEDVDWEGFESAEKR